MGDIAHGLGDELEGFLLVGPLEHRRCEGLRSTDPSGGALRIRVQVRVFDRDAGGGCQSFDDGCVLVRIAAGLTREVEAPIDLFVHQDRHAQERRSIRGQLQIGRIRRGVDEEWASHWDGRRQCVGNRGYRAEIVVLELHGCCAPGVEHGERRVRRGCQCAGLVHEVLQACLEVQRAGQVQRGLEQGEIGVIGTHCSS